jgi:hypothetical protein
VRPALFPLIFGVAFGAAVAVLLPTLFPHESVAIFGRPPVRIAFFSTMGLCYAAHALGMLAGAASSARGLPRFRPTALATIVSILTASTLGACVLPCLNPTESLTGRLIGPMDVVRGDYGAALALLLAGTILSSYIVLVRGYDGLSARAALRAAGRRAIRIGLGATLFLAALLVGWDGERFGHFRVDLHRSYWPVRTLTVTCLIIALACATVGLTWWTESRAAALLRLLRARLTAKRGPEPRRRP